MHARPQQVTEAVPRTTTPSGLWVALLSAASFATAGPLAKGLLDAGWSPGAAVTTRIIGAALVLAVPAALSLRGRWHVVRRYAGIIALYGLMAVAGAQLGFFSAVATLDVGTALLIEYLAPLIVVAWVWVVRRQPPGASTILGAVLAVGGVVLVLDLLGGTPDVDVVGVAWALFAACGLAVYFVISGRPTPGLPPIVLAAGGLVVAAVTLGVAGAIGVLPMVVTTTDVAFLGATTSPFVVVAALALVSAALAYTSGIVAARRLGPRLASFAGLTEVLFAAAFAWVLLGQSLGLVQVVGGALVVAGVVLVRRDRESGAAPEV